MIRALRAAARDESGIAAITAIIILFIVLGLVGASVSTALQTNGSTRRDGDKKNALEAAEAGLQVANYRLNMLQPDTSHCVGDTVTTPAGDGTCPSSTTYLGNGSDYTFYMTPPIGPGTAYPNATCVGLIVQSNIAISQRCITAVGESHGIIARSQIRVAAFAAAPVFPVPGMIGLKQITDSQNSTIQGIVASNGPIIDQNGSTVSGAELGPAGTFANTNQIPPPQVAVLPSPLTAYPVDPGTSATNTSPGQNCVVTPPATQTNCDYRITNGAGLTTCNPGIACDPNTKVDFNPSTRVLTMNNNATLTLTGGIYNFCEFDAPNNATITLATNVHTAVYIDSPSDPNSGCPAGTGNLKLSNNVTWVNLSQDPTALQLYVYGNPSQPGVNVVNFTNNTAFWGVLFAPSSTINLSNSSNNSAFWGAITGYVLNTSNNYHFNWIAKAGTIQANSQGVYYRTAWAQCTPVKSAGPGCG
jgi:hypothetical protein